MGLKRRTMVAVIGASTVAGCLGGEDDGYETSQADDAGNDDGGADGGGGADDGSDGGESDEATVQVRSGSDLGDILVGPDGMTLYNFDMDTQDASESSCYDDCADAWPPLTVDETPVAGADVTAELTTFERDDGSMQVAANGWPLYYFASDEEPGDAEGQGINDVWWVLDSAGTPIRDEQDGGTNGDDTADEDDETGDDDDDSGGDDGSGGSY